MSNNNHIEFLIDQIYTQCNLNLNGTNYWLGNTKRETVEAYIKSKLEILISQTIEQFKTTRPAPIKPTICSCCNRPL